MSRSWKVSRKSLGRRSSEGPWSNLNPSWVIRLHRPPVKSFFSRTVTEYPDFARRAAAATPPIPAPVVVVNKQLKKGGCGVIRSSRAYQRQ